MLVLAVFFPVTRGGVFVKPIVTLWEEMLGIPMPSYNVGPIILKALFLLAITAIACIGGIGIAKFVNRHSYGNNADLQTWGAIASILGLIIGILSLVMK
jgi:hypothetical protein